MSTAKPWLRVPSVQNTWTHPKELAKQIEQKTHSKVVLWEFEQFKQIFDQMGKTHPDLYPYAVLTNLFPRCIAAVPDGSETIEPDSRLMLLCRAFPGCKDALAALYQQHPVIDSPWNDALYEHVRMWTWTRCEICHAAELKRTGGVQ